MKNYKVLIRIRNKNTNKVVKNRCIFYKYEDAINYINEYLKVDNIIKMKFFENDKAFGVGAIWYQDNEFVNYDASLAFLKKLLTKEVL